MVRVSEALRVRLIEQLRQLYRDAEWDLPFQGFLAEARDLLPDYADENRFQFVVRRIWMDFVGEPPKGWRNHLPGRYSEFVEGYPWDSCLLPDWVDQSLIDCWLSILQPRSVTSVKPRHALAAIENAGKLVDAGVGA